MKPEQLLGRREDVAAILKALGIKEGDKPEPFFSPRKIITTHGDNGAKKTQESWIEYFNSRSEVMVSMPDLYHAGKSSDNESFGPFTLLEALQEDFEGGEITSTRMIYQPDNLNSRIAHYYGSSVVKPVEFDAIIPDYNNGKLVKEVLDDSNGLYFLQAIFGTEDDKDAILETLIKLSGRDVDNLRVWTPSQKNREPPERSILCCYGRSNDFCISFGAINVNGYSWEVQK